MNPPSRQPNWKPPPAKLALAAGEIHLWRVWLDAAPEPLRELTRFLSPDEVQRARRFGLERDARRYVAGRAALRRILAGYTGVEPGELRFTYSTLGKPRLVQKDSEATIEFNVAHAEELAIIAVGRNRRIGVDVESTRTMDGMARVADRFFSRDERTALFNLPRDQQTQAFFNGWTRKEALVKALGGGLSLPLDQFEVSLAPLEPARVLRIGGNAKCAAGWVLTSTQPAVGYTAALAVETHAQLDWWEYGREMKERCPGRPAPYGLFRTVYKLLCDFPVRHEDVSMLKENGVWRRSS